MATKAKSGKSRARHNIGSMPPNRGKGWHFLTWGNRRDLDRGYRKLFPSPRYKLLVLPAYPSSGWKYGLWAFDNQSKTKGYDRNWDRIRK